MVSMEWTIDEFEVEVEYETVPYVPATYSQPAEGGHGELKHVWVGTEPHRVDILPYLDADSDALGELEEAVDDRAAEDGPDEPDYD